ncbi:MULTISPECIES: ABC transporter ATP-binding protein [unclassified Leifsonia]|uniref:ABC transporter ATP-binding protein n=1 Tax=unclassified Leifsonia TaxID=2663824 RepID=UPI0006FF59CC|nr:MULTISPECIES: ABC transporter ATP-binding protein [unclassified Leifsonia]KQX07866.1 ABC transporter [Leifsonia sp. Root1293]KRA12147.1 ABC transporter [Leifsonia sp. Root60]
MSIALRAEGLSRHYTVGDITVRAVDEVSLDVSPGELLVIRGSSGAGKTTLLNLLGGLDSPTAGQVWVGDRELSSLDEDELAELRRTGLGYIFQGFGLIPVLSAAENIEVPLRLARMDAVERDSRVAEALALVGLSEHAAQRPSELSGGQQQRVGIARALVSRPGILLADEPTGQLDSGTAATVMDLISGLVHDRGIAAVVSTHDPLLVQRADRVLEMHDGRLRAADDLSARAR